MAWYGAPGQQLYYSDSGHAVHISHHQRLLSAVGDWLGDH